MHSTFTLLALALATVGTDAAAIGTDVAASIPLETRQIGYFYIQFFTEPNCQGTLVDPYTFFDAGGDECRVPSPAIPYPSWRVRVNGSQRPGESKEYVNFVISGQLTTLKQSTSIVVPTAALLEEVILLL